MHLNADPLSDTIVTTETAAPGYTVWVLVRKTAVPSIGGPEDAVSMMEESVEVPGRPPVAIARFHKLFPRSVDDQRDRSRLRHKMQNCQHRRQLARSHERDPPEY